ncbi:hypothetical protein D3C81_1753890 [compost metagenome]
MGLGQHGGDQYPPALTHMVEGQLVGQDGLARPRSPLDDIRGTDDQAALEQYIQALDTDFHTLELFHDPTASHREVVLSHSVPAGITLSSYRCQPRSVHGRNHCFA